MIKNIDIAFLWWNMWVLFTLGQLWPLGIVVACVCLSIHVSIGSGDCLVSTSTTKFVSDLGYRMAKNSIGLYKENTFHEQWHPLLNSLTQKNEEHNIPSQILKTILDCMTQLFF